MAGKSGRRFPKGVTLFPPPWAARAVPHRANENVVADVVIAVIGWRILFSVGKKQRETKRGARLLPTAAVPSSFGHYRGSGLKRDFSLYYEREGVKLFRGQAKSDKRTILHHRCKEPCKANCA